MTDFGSSGGGNRCTRDETEERRPQDAPSLDTKRSACKATELTAVQLGSNIVPTPVVLNIAVL